MFAGNMLTNLFPLACSFYITNAPAVTVKTNNIKYEVSLVYRVTKYEYSLTNSVFVTNGMFWDFKVTTNATTRKN
jgi:hypothetical protein